MSSVKQARWKRWLSYLWELHIESAPSEYNPHLYVSLSRGRYQLSTANAIYSYEDLYTNFRDAFRQLDLNGLAGGEVLLLGLGLGSVPHMLEKQFGRDWRYTAVEIDPNVVYLAQKYVLSGLSSPITTHCGDAYFYVLQSEEAFDLICMDIFLDDVTPEPFQQRSFLEKLKERLSPGGILLYNCLYRQEEDKVSTERFYLEVFRKVFPSGGRLDVHGNWILLSEAGGLK